MKKSRIIALVMCMVIVVTAFSGCGKSDSENSGTSDTTVLRGDLYLSAEKITRIGDIDSVTTTEYDTVGRITKKSVYLPLDSETTEETTYEYDSKGRLIAEEYVNVKWSDSDYSYTVKYTDDANGSCGVSTKYERIGFKELCYKEMYYDKQNRMVKEVAYDGDAVQYIEEYEYYDNGEMKRKARTHNFDITATSEGETYEASQTVSVYNEKGKLIETISNRVNSEGLCELRSKEDHTSSSDIPECVAYYESDITPSFRACVEKDAEGNEEVKAAWEAVGSNKYTLKSYDKYYFDTDYYITVTVEDGKIVATTEEAYSGEFTSTFEYDENTGDLKKISWLKEGKSYCDHEYVYTAK